MKLKIISFSIWNIPFLKTLKLNSKVTQGPKNIIFIFLKVQFTKLKMDQLGLLFGIWTNISYINQQLLLIRVFWVLIAILFKFDLNIIWSKSILRKFHTSHVLFRNECNEEVIKLTSKNQWVSWVHIEA